jgi:predicted nucleic acid-binding Zn ribbon protein
MAKIGKAYCKTCKKAICRPIGRINENNKLGHNFYCSKLCESQAKTKSLILICAQCKKSFKKYLKEFSINNYCSRSCATKANNKKFPKIKAAVSLCLFCSNLTKNGNKYCSNKCNLAAKQKLTEEKILQSIKATAKKLGRAPAKRELKKIVERCRWLFGSWNNALISAGLKPNRSHSQRMYKRTFAMAADGHKCDSISESIIDNWLSEQKIPHDKGIFYPKSKYKADWKTGDIFIEYFGLANDSPRYDRSIQKKKEFC